MQVEELVDEGVVAVHRREALANGSPGRAARVGGGDPGEVPGVHRAMPLISTADLVPTCRAAVVLVDRAGRPVGHGFPDDLVEDHAPVANLAAAGELVAQPDLESRLLPGMSSSIS